MRFKWQTKLPGEGCKLYIYTSDERRIAKVYESESAQDAIQTLPQVVTGSDGIASFWVDDLDYQGDQRFDIEIRDKFGEIYTAFRKVDVIRSAIHGFISDVGFSTLEDAINYAVANGKSLLITKIWDIQEDFTCDADLMILKGG